MNDRPHVGIAILLVKNAKILRGKRKSSHGQETRTWRRKNKSQIMLKTITALFTAMLTICWLCTYASSLHAAIEPNCNPITPQQLLQQTRERITQTQAAYNIASEKMKMLPTTLRSIDPLEFGANTEIAVAMVTKALQLRLAEANDELRKAQAQEREAKAVIQQLLSLTMAAHPRLGVTSLAQRLIEHDGEHLILISIFNYLLAPSNLHVQTCFSCSMHGVNFKRCSHCKVAYYCSPECQRKDRPNHAPECKP